MTTPKAHSHGAVAIVLHTHLPWVISHGRWPHGTDWLNEAVAECYVPLIFALEDLKARGVPAKLTIDISPVLCEMLSHASFPAEFESYLEQKLRAASGDKTEFGRTGAERLGQTAQFWEEWHQQIREQYRGMNGDIIGRLRSLQDGGLLEILTCGATHGYFPLLSQDESLQLQTQLAVANYRKHFGRDPQGIWLPECAYRPRYEWQAPVTTKGYPAQPTMRKGADEFLSEAGLRFFLVDTHLLKGGAGRGVYGERFAALREMKEHTETAQTSHQTNNQTSIASGARNLHQPYLVRSGDDRQRPMAVFGRDEETGILVWSGEHGYPGDGRYLDFHKKRFPGGLRYWAVTSPKADLADKVEYVREAAIAATAPQADDFVARITDILRNESRDNPPGAGSSGTNGANTLVAMYDTELFGHWWFEGPLFLSQALERIANSPDIQPIHLSERLDNAPPTEILAMPEGSWGEGGGHTIWLNPENSWTWERIYSSEIRMKALLDRYYSEYGPTPDLNEEDIVDATRVLKQALRELLLMSASDWQFLISTKAARDYAEKRFVNHHNDFCAIADLAETLLRGANGLGAQWGYLEECELRDDLFPELELAWYGKLKKPAGELHCSRALS